MNLQAHRKAKFRTIKLFAEAYGCGATKASAILNGKYHLTLSKGEVKDLAYILGITFVECADACDETFAEYMGYKGDAWKQSKRRYKGILHKGIWARWQWEEDLQRDTRKAAESGDWEAYRRKYVGGDWYRGFAQERAYGQASSLPACFTLLGLSSPTATPEQIKAAFRARVKAASDGRGGFHGDMDKLVQAKEQALQFAKVRR